MVEHGTRRRCPQPIPAVHGEEDVNVMLLFAAE
jgi:hypothetical protein